MLPWFICREILNYAVYLNHELCLVDKECFKTNRYYFYTVDSSHVKLRVESPPWINIAHNLELSEYENLDWNLLKRLDNILSVHFRLNFRHISIMNKLRYFFQRSKLESIKVSIESGYEYFSETSKLLKCISKKLKKLEIYNENSRLSFDKHLSNGYLNVKTLNVCIPEGNIALHSVCKFMPNIEELKIYVAYIEYPVTNDFLVFSHLKKLTIKCYCNLVSDNYHYLNIFTLYFPNLLSFTIYDILYHDEMNLLPQSMPKLQKLDFSMHLKPQETRIVFPLIPMLCLLDLQCKFINSDGEFNLNLANLAKLQTINCQKQLRLYNYNQHHQPLVNHIQFNVRHSFSKQVIFDQLSYLEKAEINCYLLDNIYDDILKFSLKLKNVTLFNIKSPIPTDLLVSGPFTTIHFKLAGTDFLNLELVRWLANEFQLVSLSINHECKLTKNLTAILFPALKELMIASEFADDVTYLKSIILMNPRQDF